MLVKLTPTIINLSICPQRILNYYNVISFQTQVFGAWHDEGRITCPWFKTFAWRTLSNTFIIGQHQPLSLMWQWHKTFLDY
jgi:hypothetical protein